MRSYISLNSIIIFLICSVVFNFLVFSSASTQSIQAESSSRINPSEVVSIDIDLNNSVGEMYPMWAFFGYDEPNYTYLPNGRKLLTEISELSPVPVHVRTHNLLTTDEGPRASLKWGSTNAYTEDEDGNPVYDWEVVDRIVDTWVERGMTPLMEIGFMPKELSTNPEPYRHDWEPGKPYGRIYTGWAYPPNDYEKWAELVYQWVRHSVERYGKEEVETWWWQLWNEPNIGYWQGTDEEYFKLYDYTADAVKRALPTAKIGGPNTTGPGYGSGKRFLPKFLEHCLNGTNYVSGETGSPIDFIGFHAKGSPNLTDEGHIQMTMDSQLLDVDTGFEIVSSFPKLKDLPVIIGESDPSGCAACSGRVYPNYDYTNGTLYASYTASSFAKKYKLADQYGVNFKGAVTWAFQFDNEPWFEGYRSLATNGVDKPVLNVFRMFGMMKGDRVAVDREDHITAGQIIEQGVRGQQADINALASTDGNTAWIMVWNYHDNDVAAPDAEISVNANGIGAEKALVRHYRIDSDTAIHLLPGAKWELLSRLRGSSMQNWKLPDNWNC
jgi:xylan 1,4-beta-xylosidase